MAGFFGFFDFTKPGPGVPKDTPPKKRFFLFFDLYFRKFWKLINLNVLFFISCIPIITIGPAMAGFTYVLRNFAREEHAWIWSDLKEHAFKNFRQAFLISVIDIIAIIIGVINFQFYSQAALGTPWLGYIKYLILFLGMIFVIMHFYIYQILITFKLNLRQIYKNALIFTVIKLPQNILMFIVLLLLTYGFYYYYLIGILITPFIVLSTLGFIINFYAMSAIKKYMLDAAEKIVMKTDTDKIMDDDIENNIES